MVALTLPAAAPSSITAISRTDVSQRTNGSVGGGMLSGEAATAGTKEGDAPGDAVPLATALEGVGW